MSTIAAENTVIRDDFPILQQQTHGKPLVYLDSGATSQKPQSVIDAISHYYQHDNANIHRGIYELSQRSTAAYENARHSVQSFINAKHNSEIVFTRGTTESINLVASTFAQEFLKAGDQVLISEMEHHSNIVPWQLACQQVGAELKVIPILDDGTLDMMQFVELLTDQVKIVAIAHVSNALGTVNPVKDLIKAAHVKNIPVLLDGAQAVPHMPVDVQDLDCDFYAFSSHKMYGPTGIGVLYAKQRWLEALPPYQGGGDMISTVSFTETTYNVVPYKFEAGTPNIVGAIGLAAAIDYLQNIGMQAVAEQEQALLHYATTQLRKIRGVTIIGTAPEKVGVLSFTMEQAHAHDISTILDSEGVAIRAGHHCAMPLMHRYGVAATARASLGIYNTTDDIDRLVNALHKVIELFG